MTIALSPAGVYRLRCVLAALGGATFLMGRRDAWSLVPFGFLGVALAWGVLAALVYRPDYRVRRDEGLKTVFGPPTLRGTLGWAGVAALFALLVRFTHPWLAVGQSAEAWFAGTLLVVLSHQGTLALPWLGLLTVRDS